MSEVAESTVVDYFLSVIGARADEVAFTHDGRDLTGNESLELVYSMARDLKARGIRRGDGVCVLAGNLPEAYLLQVAVGLIGARHTGLHPLASLDDHRYILKDSGAAALVYDPRKFNIRAEQLTADVGIMLSLGDGVVGEDLLAAAARQDTSPFPPAATADDVASIFYTGGTTGVPKGVVHTQRSYLFVNMQVQANWQWPTRPTLMVAPPITHAAGQMIAPALAHHGRVILVDGFDPGEFFATVERERVSVTFLVPTMLYVLLDHPDLAKRDLSSLRTVVYGAAPMLQERLEQALDVFGPHLFQGYGQTEINVGALLLRKEEHRADVPGRLAAAGRPAPGTVAAVLDDHGRPLANGQPGELVFRSTAVMSGYWNKPEQTAQVLRDGWLHTGDIAVMDEEGYVTIVDRKKDMVVTGGFNVYPKEVEDALVLHPDVQGAAVVGLPDPKWGEAVHAVVTVTTGSKVTADELRAWVKEKKGPVCAPKTVEIVTDLPVTALGKIDKKAIRRRAGSGQRADQHLDQPS